MKTFKSGKQRCAEIKAARRARRSPFTFNALAPQTFAFPRGAVRVDPTLLRPNNSYGQPLFVQRGYYLDQPFRCVDCGIHCLWTAERQRWWYEVARGEPYSIAKRCAPCRAKERERKAEARRRSLEGLQQKQARLAKMSGSVQVNR